MKILIRVSVLLFAISCMGQSGFFVNNSTNFTLYVDNNSISSVALGTSEFPFKTAADATTQAAVLNNANPSQLIDIVFKSGGTYLESLTLESVDLRRLRIVGHGVTLTALTSSKDNENLSYLSIEGVTFTGASTLLSDVGSGALGSEGVTLKSCTFSSSLTAQAIGELSVDGVKTGALSIRNVGRFLYTGSYFSGMTVLEFDNTEIKPSGVSGTSAEGYSTYLLGGLTTINNGGDYCFFMAYAGTYINHFFSGNATAIGASTELVMGPGSVHKKTNPDSTLSGIMRISRGAIVEELSGHDPNWTLSGTVYTEHSRDFDEAADERVIYTNQIYGDDHFQMGSIGHPFATIGKSISTAEHLQEYWRGWGTEQSQLTQVLIAPGSYAEGVTLDNQYNKRLEIVAATGGGHVVLQTLTAVENTENLLYLKVKGLKFTGNVSLGSDVDGATNLFGSEGVVFEDCLFAGSSVSVESVGTVEFIDCEFAADTEITNASSILFRDSAAENLDIFVDGATNEPAGFSGSDCRVYSGVIDGQHTVASGATMHVYPGSQVIADPGSSLQAGGGLIFIEPVLDGWSIASGSSVTLGHQTAKAIRLGETTTPAAITNYGMLYAKSDNKLYFQDGAGVEHAVSFE